MTEYSLNKALDELISSIVDCRWSDAWHNSFKLEKMIEHYLLTNFNVVNHVSSDFRLLRLYIQKRCSDRVKSYKCKEIISRILDKLAVYGIGVKKSDGDLNIDKELESALNRLDGYVTELMGILDIRMIDFIGKRGEYVESIKSTLNNIERIMLSYLSTTDRMEVASLIQKGIIPTLAVATTYITATSDDKGKKKFLEAIHRLKTLCKYLLMMRKHPNIADLVIEAIEEEADIKISRGEIHRIIEKRSFGEGGEEERLVKRKRGRRKERGGEEEEVEVTFDWIDKEWEKILRPPAIHLIVGSRGKGKSATAHAIAEYLKHKYGLEVYFINTYGRPIPSRVRSLLPEWMQIVEDVDDLPTNCVAICDEAHRKFSAMTMVKKAEYRSELQSFLQLIRQKNITLIFISHESRLIDKSIVSSVDTLMVKPITELQLKFERSEIQDYLYEAYKMFSRIPEEEKIKYIYILHVSGGGARYLKKVGLPSYWSEELSTFFKEV